MDIQKLMPSVIVATSIILSVLVVAVMAAGQASEYTQMLADRNKYEAVDSCFKSANVESKSHVDESDKDIVINEPVREIYAYCLADKGIEISETE